MSESIDSLSIRVQRMNQILLGRRNLTLPNNNKTTGLTASTKFILGREALLDALFVLYDECNNELHRKDPNVAAFLDKYTPVICELRKLRVNLSDFEVKKVIGRGHFGEVQLVREKQTGDVYAMKVIRKVDTLAQQNGEFFEEERDIMAQAISPWITSLKYTFQDSHYLHLVMDFHPGGDLLSLLERFDGSISEEMSQFYLAEIALSIHSLHNMGYVHRDIKPENILIDRCGHIKLADFGSAARLTSEGTVISALPIGTPDYVAPEVLLSVSSTTLPENKMPVGIKCDFWSLGIVAYEMVYGQTPFLAEKTTATYSHIMGHKNNLKFPDVPEISTACREVIRGLLSDVHTRLCFDKLTKHRFFFGINWNTIQNETPPYVPVVCSQDDTSNFDEFERSSHQISITEFQSQKTEFSGRNLPFVGFTYVKDVRDNTGPCSECGKASKENTEIEEELAQKKKECTDLRIRLRNSELECGNKYDEMPNMRNQLDENNKRIDNLIQEKEKMLADTIKYINCNNSLKQQIKLEHENRSLTESKAMDLIRAMQCKWEGKVKARSRDAEQYSIQAQQWEEKCHQLELNLAEERNQFQKAKEDLAQAEMKYQGQLTQVNKKCRYTISDLNGRLQGLLEASERKAADINAQLNTEIVKKVEARKKVHTYECEIQHLKDKLSGMEQESHELREKLLELREKLTEQVDDLQQQSRLSVLEEQVTQRCVLEEQVHIYKTKYENSILQIQNYQSEMNESAVTVEQQQYREEQLQKQVNTIRNELTEMELQREQLQQNLKSMEVQAEEHRKRLCEQETHFESLENSLGQLEVRNAQLESMLEEKSVMREMPEEVVTGLKQQNSMLQTQIDRLDNKLQKSREMCTTEKQKIQTAQDELRKKEKELSDARLDLRIVERERKEAEKDIKDIKLKEESITIILKQQEDELKLLQEEIVKLKQELDDEKMANKEEVDKLMVQIEYLQQKLDFSETRVQKLPELELQMIKYRGQIGDLEMAKSNVEVNLTHIKDQRLELEGHVEQLQRTNDEKSDKIQNLELNLSALKEVCVMQEDQLTQFDVLLSNAQEGQEKAIKQKSEVDEQITSLKQDLLVCKQQINEHKSLKIFNERKLQEIESQFEQESDSREKQTGSMQSHIDSLQSQVDSLMEQNQVLYEKRSDLELDRTLLGTQVESLNLQLTQVKEEASRYLSQMRSLQDSNFRLTQAVEDLADKCDGYKTRISELELTIHELQNDHRCRELKMQETSNQQTKLIDFLQAKSEGSGKKKKTLTDKLFGSGRQKENVASSPVIPVGYKEMERLLGKERIRIQQLNQQLLQARAEIVSLQVGSSKSHVSTPRPVSTPDDMCLQTPTSTTSLISTPMTMKRINHNIPHRFDQKLATKITKCAVCLLLINFGRSSAVCQDCGVVTHLKCSADLPATCGLPGGMICHLPMQDSVFTPSNKDQVPAKQFESSIISGWLKVFRGGKQVWEKCYACLQKTSLILYDSEPMGNVIPVDTFDLSIANNTVVISDVQRCAELNHVADSDLPFVFKVECQSVSRHYYLMVSPLQEKTRWVETLETIINQQNAVAVNDIYEGTGSIQPLHVFREVKTVQCAMQFNSEYLFIGFESGIISLPLEKDLEPVFIKGVKNVRRMVTLTKLGIVIVVAGDDQGLFQASLEILQCCAEAVSCSQPQLNSQPIENITGCKLVEVLEKSDTDGIMAVATHKQFQLFRWDSLKGCFYNCQILETPHPCTAIQFTKHSILVVTDNFFEVDLQNYSIEVFLDACDKSLSGAVNSSRSLGSIGSVVDISLPNGPPEFLLVLNQVAIFVDAYGTRSREEDIKWSKLPLSVVYSRPFLFIFHVNSCEIMRITPSACTRGKDGSIMDPPRSKFIDLKCPTFIGTSHQDGCVYVSCITQSSEVEVYCLEGKEILKQDCRGSVSSVGTIDSVAAIVKKAITENRPTCTETISSTAGDEESGSQTEFSLNTSSIIHALNSSSDDSLSMASDLSTLASTTMSKNSSVKREASSLYLQGKKQRLTK